MSLTFGNAVLLAVIGAIFKIVLPDTVEGISLDAIGVVFLFAAIAVFVLAALTGGGTWRQRR